MAAKPASVGNHARAGCEWTGQLNIAADDSVVYRPVQTGNIWDGGKDCLYIERGYRERE